MQSKEQRFRKWLGVNADSESAQRELATALLMSEYLKTVNSLDAIKDAFKDSYKSELFIHFGQYDYRNRGAILFAILVVDEALESMEPHAENQTLHQALTQLSEITWYLYQIKRPSSADVQKLLTSLNNILDLDDTAFTDKALAAHLLLSLFLILNLAEPSLQLLPSLALRALSWVIPIDEIRRNIKTLVQKVEGKVYLLTLKPDVSEELDVAGLAQARFNQRYLALLTEKPEDVPHMLLVADTKKQGVLDKLTVLQENIEQTSVNLLRLVTLRNSNQELGVRIKTLRSLLQAATENDRRVSGRMYFLDFIRSNEVAYQLFLNSLQRQEKEEFEMNVEQLTIASEEHNFSQRTTHGISWLAAPVMHTYRYVTPQKMQDVALTLMPATLDSECKRMLKQLLTNNLAQLNQTVQAQQQEIGYLSDQLFQQNEDLKGLILSESEATLLKLQKTAEQASHAVQAYRRVLQTVKENMDFLHYYQSHAETLDTFIQLHTTFWVKLSNFFTQFCWLFKTDAAKMVDAVVACKTKVGELSLKYQAAVDDCLEQIDLDASVDASIKNQFKKQFDTEISRTHVSVAYTPSMGTRSIRLLVKNLERLLATNPQPAAFFLEKEQPIEGGTNVADTVLHGANTVVSILGYGSSSLN